MWIGEKASWGLLRPLPVGVCVRCRRSDSHVAQSLAQSLGLESMDAPQGACPSVCRETACQQSKIRNLRNCEQVRRLGAGKRQGSLERCLALLWPKWRCTFYGVVLKFECFVSWLFWSFWLPSLGWNRGTGSGQKEALGWHQPRCHHLVTCQVKAKN